MSSPVLPFETAASEPELERAVAQPGGADRAASKPRASRRLVMQLAASLTPVVILAFAFAVAGEHLGDITIAGISLSTIIVAVAVVTPLLSQAVSAPIYVALDGVDYDDRATVSAAIVRVLPKGVLLAAPVAAATGLGIAAFRGWALSVALVIGASLALNLVMAMLMVATFATRRFSSLVLSWLAYGLALAAVPACAWWLPPLVGAATLLAASSLRASRATGRPNVPSWGRMVGALPRGLADAAPMWMIPPTLWVLDPDRFHAFVVFAAIIPAMIGYQAFFALMAARLWASSEAVRQALSSVGYGTARDTEIASTVRQARRVSVSVVVLNAALTSAGIAVWGLLGGSEWRTFALIAAAAASACCATTLAYQYSIIRSRTHMNRAAGALATVAIGSALLQFAPATSMVAYTVVAVGLSATLLGVNRNYWQQPEYSLFWAAAVRL